MFLRSLTVNVRLLPPAEILERVKKLDNDTLKTWTKLAARAENLEEFLAQIE